MSKFEIRRRAGFAAFVLMSTIVLSGTLAQPRAPFGGVRVDVASLRAAAGDPTARWVAEELPRALAEALASVGRAGAPVRARIDSVILGPSSGGQGPLGASPDQILGEVIVGGVARPLRASTSYYPMAVDQALVEQSNHDRVSQLVQAFAYWAAREV
jgi:predicted NBD/HSP70 family sugar kinase